MTNTSFWKNKNVLITGHNGFKGSWLSLWLHDKGAFVYGLSLENNEKESIYHSFALNSILCCDAIIDIRNANELSMFIGQHHFDVVFHLAAQPLVRESYKSPLDTWSTNVQGSLNLLEALKQYDHTCAVVMITTDKVYENLELPYAYHENDRLGGLDPYSGSKAAAEIAINSWRFSFCGEGHSASNLRVATARAGNVIGGGDWAKDRIIPDVIRAIITDQSLKLRNPLAVRPWQHVLEPLSGYIKLGEKLYLDGHKYAQAYNFGPMPSNNSTVINLVNSVAKCWPFDLDISVEKSDLHEAGLLSLQITKACYELAWSPVWSFRQTVQNTVDWYRDVNSGAQPLECARKNIHSYSSSISSLALS